ncbi:dysbindin domain-containing protein 1 isoform X2 [Pantherophis guttatus]|uniref:Dysbindin domain-containing protein 1 isoform X2 n=1 Tax=Pantherophis guttatus TaxID=94885 RepID=A0ABM3YQN4_PANGU|nr:dysbindin domain-containing protein 1 isoform X2 [Pantherophis guttatus]
MSRAPPGLHCPCEIRALSGSPERPGGGNGQASGAPLASRRARPFVSGACRQSRGVAGQSLPEQPAGPHTEGPAGARLGQARPPEPALGSGPFAASRPSARRQPASWACAQRPREAPAQLLPGPARRLLPLPCAARRLPASPGLDCGGGGPPALRPPPRRPAPPRRRCALGRPLLLLQWSRRRGGRRQRRSGHLVQPGRMETPGGAAPPGVQPGLL